MNHFIAKNYKSFLRNFYLSMSLYDMIFVYAVYNIIFSNHGLSVFEISILLAWWNFTAIVAEVPSGALADFWSRRKMLILGPLIKILCFVSWFFADGNFYLYALGFLFWGVASTFISGTKEAFLYDSLALFDKKDDYEKVLSKQKSYFNFSVGLAIITGGFMAEYSQDLVLLSSLVPLVLSAIFASFMKEVPKIKSTEEVHYFEYIKIAYREIRGSAVLKYLFVYSLIFAIFMNLDEYDQLYYRFVGMPYSALGIVIFIESTMAVIGSYFAYKLKNIRSFFCIAPLFGAISLVLVGLFPSMAMIIVLLGGYFVLSPLTVLIDSKIQHNIASMSRATIMSVKSLMVNLAGVFFVLICGAVSKIFSLPLVYIASGIICGIFVIWAVWRRKVM